jgi:hypothetical protein
MTVLCTATDVTNYCPYLTGSTNLTELIAVATERIKEYCRRNALLATTDIVEYPRGVGSRELRLREYPISGVTSVVNQTTGETIDVTHIDDEWGIIQLEHYTTVGTLYEVTYDAGYSSLTVVPKLKLACVALVDAISKDLEANLSASIKSRRLGDAQVEFFDPSVSRIELPAHVERLLIGYRSPHL